MTFCQAQNCSCRCHQMVAIIGAQEVEVGYTLLLLLLVAQLCCRCYHFQTGLLVFFLYVLYIAFEAKQS